MQQVSNNEAVNHAAAQRRQQQQLQAGGACKHPIIISNQKQCFRAAMMKRGTKTPAAWSHAAALRPTAGTRTRTRTRSGLAGGPAVSAAERSEVQGSGLVLDLTGGAVTV